MNKIVLKYKFDHKYRFDCHISLLIQIVKVHVTIRFATKLTTTPQIQILI